MNTTKTQLIIGGRVKRGDLAEFQINVDGVKVKPSRELEMLGVKFDTTFGTAPHVVSMAVSARQRASLVARLSCHLPRGVFLSQLARGLVLGKVGYALAAVSEPRLDGGTHPTRDDYRVVQVAINDVARSVIGKKRTDDSSPNRFPSPSRGDASYRLCGIFAVLEILEDLSGLGWILETHSLHAFMGTKERRSTLYFRSGSVATRKSYSCLVETGKLRRLAVNKDQWSESMLEHLNFSLKDSYPRLKSGPSSQALVLVAMGEGAPEQWALLGDPLDTKLSHVCQFLTISIDYLQCAGFQIEGSLSLFADGMTIVLFSMDSR
eukprot:snap_masked-scaffold829_size91079-processed-gene-0.2 protein:Tk01797 transcript:snap_masked-scaffold829_size91079-processed-gene-0.2-mRNA-1 annotation:"unnamed protein product"